MGVRLRDVAAAAGVSVKTVSNVVHGHVNVAPPTRARVQAAIDELNYRPNLSARTLRQGRSGVIALAVPELNVSYFAELAGHVVDAAYEHGLTVLVDQTDGRLDRERLVMGGFPGHLIDGLILSPVAVGRAEIASCSNETPLVLLGEKLGPGPADHVAIDNVAAARVATDHLLDLGRRRVAAIGAQPHPPDASGVARLRCTGYVAALRARGQAVDERLVASVPNFRRSDGANAMAALLDAGAAPDAVFCFTDALALGALRTLADRGVSVPDDVAVIGLDDIEDGRYSIPTLSTVAPDKAQIAQLAVQLLCERLDAGRDTPPREIRADFRLVPRESTIGGAVSAVGSPPPRGKP